MSVSVQRGKEKGAREMLMRGDLWYAFVKGRRNGNWKKLARMEKALYRAALAYMSGDRKIVSESVVNKLLIIIKKLLETPSQRIFKRGFEKAVWLIREMVGLRRSSVLLSALNNWLRNPDYIFWLGTVQ